MRGSASRVAAGLAVALLLALMAPAALVAQATGRVRVAEENFRRAPNGTVLATVLEGAELPVVGERGRWVEVDLGGWIWGPSVSGTDREGFDLRVVADGGENLRVRPQGPVVAILLEGALLERVETEGNWHRVRRRGWLWKPSLELLGSAAGRAESAAEAEPDPAATDSAEADTPTLLTTGSRLPVHATPDGDTVAVFQPGAQTQVLGRAGDWIRVRVDGWVYGPAATDSLPGLADTGDLTPALLRADPGRYRGALVRWRVQIVSLMHAERARVDFEEGEPFLLARGASGDAGFVYLAVPEGLLAVAERIQPLEHVTIVGRVRTGRSSQVGSPVIDLADIELDRPGG